MERNRFAVIIPSRNIDNLLPCVKAVRLHEPGAPIVVVSDGLDYDKLPDDLFVAEGAKPFVFARNINIGIRRARMAFSPDAFVLLNDDALLVTPGGFSQLARSAVEHADFGVISAVCNYIGNPAQSPHHYPVLREEPKMLCFVCVLIPHRIFEAIGLLDERFTDYGWEDGDFCRRVRDAGLRLGICDQCYVDHGSLRSTFRGAPEKSRDISAGREIYRAKWGNLA